jgi:mRNA interferase RelE/StbE
VSYAVTFTEEAREQLKTLPTKALQKKILTKIEILAESPIPNNAKKLKGYDTLYRIRFSEWRIVYDVIEMDLVIAVIRIGHRSAVYEKNLV